MRRVLAASEPLLGASATLRGSNSCHPQIARLDLERILQDHKNLMPGIHCCIAFYEGIKRRPIINEEQHPLALQMFAPVA